MYSTRFPRIDPRTQLEHHYDPGACSSKKCTSCLSTAYQPAWENIRIGTTSTQPALDDCLVDVQSIDIPTSKKLQIASRCRFFTPGVADASSLPDVASLARTATASLWERRRAGTPIRLQNTPGAVR